MTLPCNDRERVTICRAKLKGDRIVFDVRLSIRATGRAQYIGRCDTYDEAMALGAAFIALPPHQRVKPRKRNPWENRYAAPRAPKVERKPREPKPWQKLAIIPSRRSGTPGLSWADSWWRIENMGTDTKANELAILARIAERRAA